MYRIVLPMLLGLLTLAGCTPKEEPKPENAPPPPPTAEEQYAKLRGPVEPMFASVNNSGFSNAQRSQAVEGLRTAKNQLTAEMATPQGINIPPALKRIQGDIENLIRDAKKADNQRVVKGGIEAYKIFQPADKRWDEDEKYADLILARPSVAIDGFFDLDVETYVFAEVTDANTGKKDTYKIREGEDFHEVLQLVRIIGRRDAIEILYKPVNQTWTVKSPSKK